jgi:hypothetical protein
MTCADGQAGHAATFSTMASGGDLCGRPAGDLALRKGQEFDCLDPRCKRARRDDAANQALRTGDKGAAWTGVSIHGSLTRQQQARRAQHLLRHGTIKPANTACGTGLGSSATIIVIEREVRTFRPSNPARQSGLA